MSTATVKALSDAGVRHQLTAPYTPEQNGVAERANRTLIECARTMMQHAKLPTEFWAEAVSHAATLTNITPREGPARAHLLDTNLSSFQTKCAC